MHLTTVVNLYMQHLIVNFYIASLKSFTTFVLKAAKGEKIVL